MQIFQSLLNKSISDDDQIIYEFYHLRARVRGNLPLSGGRWPVKRGKHNFHVPDTQHKCANTVWQQLIAKKQK